MGILRCQLSDKRFALINQVTRQEETFPISFSEEPQQAVVGIKIVGLLPMRRRPASHGCNTPALFAGHVPYPGNRKTGS